MQPSIRLPGPITLTKDAWKIFKSRSWLLASMAFIPLFIMYALNSLAFVESPITRAIAVLGAIIGLILCLAMAGALVSTIHKIVSDPTSKTTVDEAFRFGFKYFWPYLFVVILVIPITIGSGILFVIPYIMIIGFAGFYPFALFLDDKRGFSAFTESYSLVKGRWWKVFGRMAAMAVVIGVISAVITAIFAAISTVAGHNGDGDLIGYIIIHIGGLIVDAVVIPFAMAYMYKLYIVLKETRQPNVSTSVFKNWLIAFLVIGILVIVGLVLAIPALIVIVIGSLSASGHHIGPVGGAFRQTVTY